MSDITPKPVAATAQPVAPTVSITAASAPPAMASAAEIPAAIANLSVGTFVTGTVLERGPRGLAVLRTDKGTIKLYTPVPLKQGSTVTLQIQSVGAQVQLSILSIDGHPLAQSAARTPPATVRADNAPIRTAGGDTPLPQRSPVAHGAAGSPSTTSSPIANEAGAAAPAANIGDRNTSDRTAATRPSPNQPMASGFVSRPLIASASAANVEVLAPTPLFTTPAAAGTTSAATPHRTTPANPAATAQTTALATTDSTPENMVLGGRFTASFTAPPAMEASTPPRDVNFVPFSAKPDSPLTTGAPTAILPATVTPSTSTLPAPTTSATVPLPSSEQVILRLLGMTPPSQGNTSVRAPVMNPTPSAPTMAGAPPIAAGLTVADDAITTVGVIMADSQSANRVSGNVAATAPKTLVNTPFGVLTVAGAPPGPVGTKLLLEVVLRNDAPMAALHQADGPTWLATSAMGRGSDMAALREIITAARHFPAETADHLLNVTLPRPGPQLAAGLLFFAAALRQGSPRAWLGEQTVDALRHSGQHALIDKLADEFAGLTRLATEVSPNGWQTMLLPLFDGERVQQIRLHMRRQRRKADGRGDGTRFMIEAELSKFGPLQLDGLFSKPQFDLVVRTSVALPPEIRGDIIDIFSDSLLATNLKGAVSFHTAADIRPGPPADEPQTDADAGIGLIV